MDPLRSAAQQHLEAAIAAYGADLLLPVPGPVRHPAPDAARITAPEPPGLSRPQPSPAPAPAHGKPAPLPAAAKAPPLTKAADSLRDAAGSPPDLAGLDLAGLRRLVLQCRRCKLCEHRRTVVFGEGSPSPPVLFVGEAPGAVEDRMGRPFVGPAGQLLDRIIEHGMGLQRADVYIANINKCRPPGNRDPEPDEVAACLPFLRRQVELLAPRVIVALGRIAAHNLLGTSEPMRALRGRELAYAGIPVVVTWHPAFLLRDPSRKAETWEDIKRANRLLGRPEDPRQARPGR